MKHLLFAALLLSFFTSNLVWAKNKKRTKVNEAERARVEELVSHFTGASEIQIKQTTREHIPKFEVGFAAGRYAVDVKNGEKNRHFVLQTEGRVSHFEQVIPGKSKIDGFVAEAPDEDSQTSLSAEKKLTKLNKDNERRLLVGLLRNWGAPEEIKEKPSQIEVIQMISAIYSDGDKEKLKAVYYNAGKGQYVIN